MKRGACQAPVRGGVISARPTWTFVTPIRTRRMRCDPGRLAPEFSGDGKASGLATRISRSKVGTGFVPQRAEPRKESGAGTGTETQAGGTGHGPEKKSDANRVTLQSAGRNPMPCPRPGSEGSAEPCGGQEPPNAPLILQGWGKSVPGSACPVSTRGSGPFSRGMQQDPRPERVSGIFHRPCPASSAFQLGAQRRAVGAQRVPL